MNYAPGINSVVVGGQNNQSVGIRAGIYGGQGNLTSATFSGIYAGGSNTIEDGAQNGAILGGINNTLTKSAAWGVAVGGANGQVTAQQATVIGGYTNTASGLWSLAAGGTENTSSGNKSVAIGGTKNTSSGNKFVAIGGTGNLATGTGGIALGGTKTSAIGMNATAIGGGVARGINSVAIGNDSVNNDDFTHTISFGHKAGDKDGQNIAYASEGYNRLVNVGYGINGHDAVTVDQLTTVSSLDGTIQIKPKPNEAYKQTDYALSVTRGKLALDNTNTVIATPDTNATLNQSFATVGDVADVINKNTDNINKKLDNKANTNLDNLTSEGQGMIGDIAKEVVKPELNQLGHRINTLDNKVNKVGAGAAALAALHPLDFDPDDKWNFAAGYGNYSGANAMAVGAYYRPNEDTMFSVAGSMGNGENMVNAGVSFKLGQKNSISNSRVAIAKEVEDLKTTVSLLVHENKELKQVVRNLQAGNRNVTFSDVPTEHWAYNYVKTLADKGLLEGYPDGTFKGNAPMTRYEFAAIIYRALQNGATIDANMQRAMNEFAPELEKVSKEDRFRVDRVAGNDNDRHKIERVRVNNEDKKNIKDYRDVYGSKIDIIADKIVTDQSEKEASHHVDLWAAINNI